MKKRKKTHRRHTGLCSSWLLSKNSFRGFLVVSIVEAAAVEVDTNLCSWMQLITISSRDKNNTSPKRKQRNTLQIKTESHLLYMFHGHHLSSSHRVHQRQGISKSWTSPHSPISQTSLLPSLNSKRSSLEVTSASTRNMYRCSAKAGYSFLLLF